MRSKLIFLISLFLLIFFPSLPLFFFAPYIVASCYRFSPIPLLWRVLGVALLVSLFSSSEPFPYLPLLYCGATIPLIFHARTIFSDRWFTLPLMTYLFSFYASIASFLFLPLFGRTFALSGQVIVTEIFLAPLSDTLLAGIVSLTMLRRKKAAA